MATGELMTSPDKVKQYLQLKLSEEPNETFTALFLTNRHMVIRYEELFHGTVDGASVHPIVVAQRCLLLNASAVIFAHNHPSGVAEPSQADIQITQRFKNTLVLVDVRVLDHIVVGAGGITSWAERGVV
ncbi:MAG: JAB domain-containing protein [Sedimenticola sp.]